MINRNELEKKLKEYSYRVASNNVYYNSIINYCKDNYDVPVGITSDLISLRKTFSEASSFILFVLLNAFISTSLSNSDNIKKHFTQKEIEKFSGLKYEEEKLEFPIIINAIQVNDDQWIGTISSKTLMLMRKAQIINYEENTQRVKKRVVRGDNVFFEISLKKKTIDEISAKLAERTYISDDLTLNIPYESNANFYYDKAKMQLVIKSIDAFDMIDGYHRYISICKSSDQDQDFEYNMELRITNFDESKCQRFIYQKDQKTKMSKVDSDTYNPDDLSNMVVTRLNDNPASNIKGMIKRNDGLISFAELSSVIRYFYFKNKVPKSEERVEVVKVTSQLMNCFNSYSDIHYEFLTKKHDLKELAIILYVYINSENKTGNDFVREIDSAFDKFGSTNDNNPSVGRTMKKSIENEIKKVLAGEKHG